MINTHQGKNKDLDGLGRNLYERRHTSLETAGDVSDIVINGPICCQAGPRDSVALCKTFDEVRCTRVYPNSVSENISGGLLVPLGVVVEVVFSLRRTVDTLRQTRDKPWRFNADAGPQLTWAWR